MRIAVTGSSGLLGRHTVDRLRVEGHEVLGLDLTGTPGAGFVRVDLGDYGQTLDALLGVTARHTGLDALVHLAAIPVNGLVPDVTTFHSNVTGSFNAVFAALRAGIRTIVTASSITAMGFPFDEAPPVLPVDETVTRANNTYGLGKVAEEAIAAQLVRWHDGTSITALRLTNIVPPGGYDSFDRAGELDYRRDLIGSYVDARDAARAVALALAHAQPGFEIYNVAAPDSGLDIPTVELAAAWFPGVSLGEVETHGSLMSTAKARQRLGFVAEHRWREERAAR